MIGLNTDIIMANGHAQAICQCKVGDMIMTQEGDAAKIVSIENCISSDAYKVRVCNTRDVIICTHMYMLNKETNVIEKTSITPEVESTHVVSKKAIRVKEHEVSTDDWYILTYFMCLAESDDENVYVSFRDPNIARYFDTYIDTTDNTLELAKLDPEIIPTTYTCPDTMVMKYDYPCSRLNSYRQMNITSLKQVLSGFIDSIGVVDKTDVLFYPNAHETIYTEIRTIASFLGIRYSITKNKMCYTINTTERTSTYSTIVLHNALNIVQTPRYGDGGIVDEDDQDVQLYPVEVEKIQVPQHCILLKCEGDARPISAFGVML